MEEKHGGDFASTKVNFMHIAKIFELIYESLSLCKEQILGNFLNKVR